MKLVDLKQKNIPDSPGVYFFQKGKEILYIGKATSLKNRTQSYFASDLIKIRGPAILDMVTKADDVSYEKTESVLEALILESKLIKKYKPKYNTKEKDDKSYNYVLITDENFPRIFTVRGRELKQKKVSENKIILKTQKNLEKNKALKNNTVKIRKIFGPFPNGSQLSESLKIIRKIFPFFDNKRPSRLYIEIGLTPDPEKINQTEYKRNIRNVELFFQGKKNKIIKNLEQRMKKLSKTEKYEEAEKAKKQIFSLRHINDISLISESLEKNKENFRIEAYDVAHLGGSQPVGVMVVSEDGIFDKESYRKFLIKEAKGGDDSGSLKEILRRRFNHTEWPLPKLIVIDGGKIQFNATKKILEEYGYEIKIVSVVKDDRHKPKNLLGDKNIIKEKATDILKLNHEAHRFAIAFHRKKRAILF